MFGLYLTIMFMGKWTSHSLCDHYRRVSLQCITLFTYTPHNVRPSFHNGVADLQIAADGFVATSITVYTLLIVSLSMEIEVSDIVMSK